MARSRRVCGAAIVALLALLPVDSRAQDPAVSPMAAALQEALVDAIARAERSVVAIARVRTNQRGVAGPPIRRDSPLGPIDVSTFSAAPTSPDFVPNEYATGVVIDRQGHILTNYHALGDPKENDYYIWVQRRPFLATRVEVPVELRAGDPWTDLAVLKISAEHLQPIRFGDASKLRKGMIVIALGNPYAIARDGEASASWGIVSNLRRTQSTGDRGDHVDTTMQSLHQFGTLIQTDARLNLGTSGGALVNLKGEMVGLTTSLAALTGSEQAAGFAIPVDDAFRKTVETLKQGRIPSYGFLGVQPDHLSLTERRAGEFGARVLYVVTGTPAAQAGLRSEDVITHVNGREVADKNALFRELSRLPAESKIVLTFSRRDPLLKRPRSTTASVVLSKKYIEAGRKAFAQVKEPQWRGLHVEYVTALPPQWNSKGPLEVDPSKCVAVLAVRRDSPAWKAGLRRGQYISHVGSRPVATPREFHAAVANQTRAVRLQLVAARGEESVHVAPASAE